MIKIHSVLMPFFRMTYPPLGIACLSAHLKRHNIDLNFTDFRAFKNDVSTCVYLGYKDNFVADILELPLILAIIKNYRDNAPILKGIDEVIKEYVAIRPLNFFKLKQDIVDIHNIINKNLPKLIDSHIVLFTTYETNLFFTVMCSLILRQKNPNIIMVYGGPQMTQSENSRKLVLKLGLADVVVIGEGENPVLDIIKSYISKRPLSVKGTMTYDKSKHTFLTEPAQPLDINTLSCPDFSIFDFKAYLRKNFQLPLYTSRGCPYKCNFCNEWALSHNFRQLKPQKVIGWMKDLNREYGAFSFWFADSLLNASLPWLEEFSDRLFKAKLDFQWCGYFRAQMNKKLAQKLKKSGLSLAFIGIETFSQSILEYMNKRRSANDNLESIEAFISCDIPLELSSLIGHPNESGRDFQKRWHIYIDLFKRYEQILFNNETFQLRPGSNIYENMNDFGLSIKKWNSKIIDLIPEATDIISRIPMSVKGRPTTPQIIQRKRIMDVTFRDNFLDLKFGSKFNKDFLRKLLNHIKPSYKVRLIARNIYIIPTQRQGALRKEIFVLHWEKGQHAITLGEKMMFERFNGKMALSNIAKELSERFNKDIKECIQEILNFLKDLLDKDVIFEILP